jgi:hypothetical protein
VIDSEQLRRDILEDGREDYYGLYEIIWSLNHKYPAVSREQKIAVARQVFTELLRDGRVEVFENVWASKDFKPVNPKTAVDAVKTDAAFADPGPDASLWFATKE